MSPEIPERRALAAARRVVVKVGSALLAAGEPAFERVAAQILALRGRGIETVLVSSGAIALGLEPLGFARRPSDLAGLQAAAAAGQGLLMGRWAAAMRGAPVAQVLLTHADIQDHRRYLNARAALLRLLEAGALPVINENDTVAVDEIRFGDNDTLAAEVLGLVSGDLLVLLTTADGLYDADPRTDPAARRVPIVRDIDERIRAMAGPADGPGTGGMVTKIEAARRARRHGAATIVAPGAPPDILPALLAGEDLGTLFAAPPGSPRDARRRWISALRPVGAFVVEPGAAVREDGLPLSAVLGVRGAFGPGDPVDVCLPDGRALARGLAALGVADAARAAGLPASRAALSSVAEFAIRGEDLVTLEAL